VVSSRLVVLGSCGAWPEAGRACSGYLLEHDGFRVVMDLGYGTLPRLLTLLGSSVAAGIDAVIVSHKHADHMVDLHGLFRARWFGWPSATSLPLYAPDGVVERLQGLEEDDASSITEVLDWHPLPAPAYDLGPFVLESRSLPHFVPNAGVRMSADGLTVAYTGDTGPDNGLADLGRDADLFIVEASDRHQREPASRPPTDPQMHLTARQAGEAAAAARARRLLLTHFWPDNDRELSRASTCEAYDGAVLLAEEGLQVAVS
jgi:ribonuclease BN (tRNA processing enzyme)